MLEINNERLIAEIKELDSFFLKEKKTKKTQYLFWGLCSGEGVAF